MSYRELQKALKILKEQGKTKIKLNATKAELQAEYDRLQVKEEDKTTENRLLDLRAEAIRMYNIYSRQNHTLANEYKKEIAELDEQIRQYRMSEGNWKELEGCYIVNKSGQEWKINKVYPKVTHVGDRTFKAVEVTATLWSWRNHSLNQKCRITLTPDMEFQKVIGKKFARLTDVVVDIPEPRWY